MKKKIKLFLIAILILIILFTLFLHSSISNIIRVQENRKEALSYYLEDGNTKYTVEDNTLGGYTIKEIGNYFSSSYTVPSNISGYNINVFSGLADYSMGTYPNTNITELTIPNTINYVTSGIFSESLLEYVETVNYNVTNFNELGYNFDPGPTTNPRYSVFGEYDNRPLTSLKTINIGNGVKIIPANFAANATKLKRVNIPNTVTEIRDYAFYRCTSLEEITLPNSLTKIGNYAFQANTNLKSIYIPDSVKNIGAGNFYNLTIKCLDGSYALQYAIENGITYEIVDSAPIKSLTVMSNPTKTVYVQNSEDLNLSGGYLKVTYLDGSTENVSMTNSKVSVTGFDNTTIGTKNLTLTYGGETVQISVSVIEKLLQSISIKSNPTKTTYIQNYGTLDLTGGKITLTYNDTSTEEKNMSDSGVNVTGFNNLILGTNRLTVTYGGKTATFNVTIVAKELTGIAVKVAPTKITYIQNYETLDLAGGKITLTYNDTSTEEKNMSDPGVSVTGFNNSTLGINRLTVTYGEKTATFDVTIVAKELTGIVVKTNPTKTTYIQNYEALDLTGGKITLTYNDTSTEEKNMGDSGVNVTGFNNSTLGRNILTVTYGGKTATFDVTIAAKSLNSIAVTTNPIKTSYVQNKETLDLAGGKITLKYNDTSTEEKNMSDSGVSVTGFDNRTLGRNILTVIYGEKTATFEVTIVEKSIIGVTIKTAPSKTTYKEGETEIDLINGELTLIYDNDTSKDILMVTDGAVTPGVTVSGFDTTALGIKPIRVSYNGMAATPTYNIEVIQKIDYEEKPDGSGGIIITGPETPGEGEEGNPDVVIPDNVDGKPVTEIGDKAFAKPVEIDTIEIPDSVTKIADNAFEGNEDAIIICNPGSAAEEYAKDHDMSYIYKDKTITGIQVTTPPAKVEYLEGKENLNLAGGRLTVTYAEKDGTGTNLTSTVRMTSPGVTTSGFNNTTAGQNTVTVTFRDKETTFNVTITAKSITKIELTTAPSKTTYKEGEEIDLIGGELTVTYDNGTTEVISMATDGTITPGVTVNGFDTTTLGIKTITVSYNGVVATPTYNIEVIQKTLGYEENPDGSGGIIITRPETPGEGENGNPDVVIPDNVDGKPVTEIGDKAFAKPVEIDTIEIPDSVTKIADNAFEGNEDAIIICNPGSAAEEYAKDHDMSYIYKDKTITGIEVTTLPTKVEYLENKETLDITGGRLTVTYAETDAEGTNLTSKVRMTSAGVATSGFNNTVVGTNTVTVTFRDKETTFNVTITEKSITGVTIKTTPSKVTYKEGEEIDLTGGELTVTYDNGTTEVIPMATDGITTPGVTVNGFDTTTLGTKTITVTYNGVVATPTYNIEVIQKIEYEENPDGSGGIIITRPETPEEGEEGNPDVVIPGEIDGKPVTEIGDKAFAKPVEIDTIEIPDSVTKIADNAFEGNEDAIIICNPGSAAEEYAKDHDMSYIYKDKTIAGIEVTTLPTKVEYLENKETLDITGGRLTVTYAETDAEGTNLTSKVRMTSAGVATSGFNNTVVGTNEITVSFREKSAKFNVEIKENNITTLGDINGDGKINSTDLLLLKRHIIAGSKTEWILVDNSFKAGDMNADNKINATDLLLLKRKIVNM